MLSDVIKKNIMIDPDFITRAQELMKPCVDEYLEQRRKNIDKWNKENPEKLKESQIKYNETDKGRYANSKKGYNRRKKFKEACEDLSWHEKELIGRFYKNCPKGYEVDHIIPVSKGGKHILSNLQYLTANENRQKSAKLNWKKND
jgi:5-methylcytosine-specific restriction endonuclease McrA